MFLVPKKKIWRPQAFGGPFQIPNQHQILLLKSLKPYKTNKNRWVLTFLQWKIVCIIVRPHRWFLRMTTNLNKCRTTCFDVLRALENLSAHEWRSLISKFWFLTKFCQNFASEELLRPWNPQNHQVVTFSSLKTVWSVVWCFCLLLSVTKDLN